MLILFDPDPMNWFGSFELELCRDDHHMLTLDLFDILFGDGEIVNYIVDNIDMVSVPGDTHSDVTQDQLLRVAMRKTANFLNFIFVVLK